MNLCPHVEKRLDGTGYARTGKSVSSLFTVSVDQELASIRLNFVEQVTSITSVVDTVTGTGVGWSLPKRYYHSTDGVTWVGPISEAALLALVFDPNEKLYLGVDYVANGVPLGPISVWHLQFNFAFYIAANSGRMFFDELRIFEDTRDILAQVIDQMSPLYDERKHFQFAWGTGEKCVPDGTRPNVFAHDMKVEETFRNSTTRKWQAGCRMGIRRKCVKNHQHFELFRGIIKQRFGERGNEFRYDLLLNSTWYLGIKLGDIGIWGLRCSSDAEIADTTQDVPCGCTWWETSVQFTIFYTFTRNMI